MKGLTETDYVDALAEGLANRINHIPDSLSNEYASRIYRDRNGFIRSTRLTRQPPGAAKNWSPPDIPADAIEEIGVIHNHPVLEGLRLAMEREDYRNKPAVIRNYLENGLGKQSKPDEWGVRAYDPKELQNPDHPEGGYMVRDPRRLQKRTNYIVDGMGRLKIFR